MSTRFVDTLGRVRYAFISFCMKQKTPRVSGKIPRNIRDLLEILRPEMQ